jgi:hypothetical protein
LFRDKHADNK